MMRPASTLLSAGVLTILATLGGLSAPPAVAVAAPDAEAGRAKAAASCAACHGANGISVTDTIPNLAGQKPRYLETQLRALQSGARKNDVMAAVAAQLSADDIVNLAAWFSSQPGPASQGARSAMLPALEKPNLVFPADYAGTFTRYHTINFPATKQVRHYFANPAAVAAAKAGTPLPDGAYLFAEVWSAKLDADGRPVTGGDGYFVADKLLFYTAMARAAGWGDGVPANIRNENWNYAVFTLDKAPRPGVNQAECLACHQPKSSTSYLFTLKELSAAAGRR